MPPSSYSTSRRRRMREQAISYAPVVYDFDEDPFEPSTPSHIHVQYATPDVPPPTRNSATTLSRIAPKRSKIHFTWAGIHRHALWMLRERYRCQWKETASIFNELFKDDVVATGLRNLKQTTLSIQLHESKKGSSRSWQKVLNAQTNAEASPEVRNLMKAIEERLASSASSSPLLQSSDGQPGLRDRSSRHTIDRTIPHELYTSHRQLHEQRSHIYEAAVPSPTSSQRVAWGHQSAADASQKVQYGAQRISKYTDVNYVCQPIGHEEAHPPLPAIFYRYYDENSFGINGPNGFVASYFQHNNVPLPPPLRSEDPLIFGFIENHLNKNPVSSPFISVAMDLFWIIRLAIKRSDDGAKNPRISFINADIAGANKRAYWVPPFHKELTKKRAFTGGAWMYKGISEMLIWAKIPPEALIVDMSLNEIINHVSSNPVMATVMQLDQIAKTRVGVANIRNQLRNSPVVLTHDITAGIANLLLAFGIGIDGRTPPYMIAKLISDIIRGWKITLDVDSLPRWRELSGVFAYVITNKTRHVDEQQLESLKDAFLCGLRSGLGGVNWQYNAELTAKMQRKASQTGLDNAGSHLPGSRRGAAATHNNNNNNQTVAGHRSTAAAVPSPGTGRQTLAAVVIESPEKVQSLSQLLRDMSE